MSNHYDNFQMPNNLNHQHHSHHNNDNTFSINDHSDSFTPNHSSLFSNSNDIINANPNNSSSSSGVVKETGIIEKMLVSYGFIQCCERQARLFFHFSQYLGNTDHLKIGDPVEYEMSYDRRTGKPVAINIRKITSDDFMTKLIRTERVSGVIATEPATSRGEGRVAFENGGEFFFLPFTQEDILENVLLKAKDKVSFIIVTDDSGNYRAKDINLELAGGGGGGDGRNSGSGIQCQGTISSIKDTFGFIERADTSANIFFHSSDCLNFKSLSVGENVEFVVTTRKNKDLATNVTKMATITSVEEVSDTVYKGQIIKYTPRPFNISASASLSSNSGKINCIELNKELPFTDKDVKGFFTLANYDLVSFQICTDRRNGAQRACNITFMPESFTLNSETRERGYVASLKETYGFIKCPSKEGSLIYFKLTEVIDYANPLKLNDEVEFTYNTDPQTRKFQANRISTLPNGTLFNILPRGISKQTSNNSGSNNNGGGNSNLENNNFPLIDLSSDMDSQMVITNNIASANKNNRASGLVNGNATAASDVWQQLQENNANNKVPIQLDSLVAASSGGAAQHHNFGHQSPSNAARNLDAFGGNTDLYFAQNNSIFNLNGTSSGGSQNQNESSLAAQLSQSNGEYFGRTTGFVVAVKESYCFIESLDGENEYFGHQSSYLDADLLDHHPLEMGQTVEFTAAYVNGKWKATEIRRTRGPPVAMYEGELSDLCTGIVLRTIQMFNGDQAEYCGLVARTDQLQTLDIDLAEAERSIEERYEFSMTSFKYLKDYIAVGDMVKFQVGTAPGTGKQRAYNVEVLRERIKGTIYVMSRMYGFVKADVENESRKVYFNRGEVVGSPRLKVGDLVDFYLVDNKKSEKCYAIDIVKLESAPGDGTAAGGNGSSAQAADGDAAAQVSVPRFKNLQMAKDKAESGPKVVVIRQPRAPDGTKGFSAQSRTSAAAGANSDTEENGGNGSGGGGIVGQ